MQRLVLALLLLAVITAGVILLTRMVRDSYSGERATGTALRGPAEGSTVAKVAWAGLMLLIAGVSFGWVEGL